MSSYTSLAEPECIPADSILRTYKFVEPEAAHASSVRRQRISTWSFSRAKRVFDVVISVAVLAVFGVPMLLIALLIRLTSEGPAIFVQKRVGRGGRLFSIYKFRSMELVQHARGAGLTKAGDIRVTSVGRWLRKLKLDELPQFYNILRGDMSLVGPRPKLPQYADSINIGYRPGITGAASLAFRHEENILACVTPPELESFYHLRIKPMKASIDRQYMKQATFASDLKVVFSTVFATVIPHRFPALRHHEVEQFSATMTGEMGRVDPRRNGTA